MASVIVLTISAWTGGAALHPRRANIQLSAPIMSAATAAHATAATIAGSRKVPGAI